MSERDIWEVSNQLGSYVGPNTEPRLAKFLLREANAAADLAKEIVELKEHLAIMYVEAENARWKAYEECAKIVEADMPLFMSLGQKTWFEQCIKALRSASIQSPSET